MHFATLRIMVFTLLLGPAGQAGAETLDEILAPVAGTSACWQRVYPDTHLADHPRQKVTSVRFSLAYHEMDHHKSGEGEYNFAVDIETRERSGSVVGLCHADSQGRIICGGECDAGVLSLRRSGSQGSLLLTLESSALSLTECGSDLSFRLSAKPDDEKFLVHPAACVDDLPNSDAAGN